MERGPHGGLDAIDVNVQLVLCAAIDRVDGQADLIPPKDPADPLLDIPAGTPRLGPIVRRGRRTDGGVLDPGHASRGDQHEMCGIAGVLEDHIAAGEVDLGTRAGASEPPLIRHAGVMHDEPEGIGITRDPPRQQRAPGQQDAPRRDGAHRDTARRRLGPQPQAHGKHECWEEWAGSRGSRPAALESTQRMASPTYRHLLWSCP